MGNLQCQQPTLLSDNVYSFTVVCIAFLHFQKGDKWTKMMSQEENMVMVNEFLEKGDERVLVIALTPQGQLCPATTFPASSKTKVCVFTFVREEVTLTCCSHLQT